MSNPSEQNGYRPESNWVDAAVERYKSEQAANAEPDPFDEDLQAALEQSRSDRAAQQPANEAAFAEAVANFKANAAGATNIHSAAFGIPTERQPSAPQGEFDSDKYERTFGIKPGWLHGVKDEAEARKAVAEYYGRDVVAEHDAAVQEARTADLLRELTTRADKHADEWKHPRFGDSSKGLTEQQLYERSKVATHVSRQIAAHMGAGKPVPPIGALLNRARMSLYGELPGRFEKPVQHQSIHHAVLGNKS